MRTRDIGKEQLIRKEAIKMIVKQGLDGFSIQNLAKAAKVSPATIYIYYKDKEDLIVTLGAEVFEEVLTHSLKDFSPDMSFAEGLKIQWKNRAAYFMNQPLKVQFIELLRYSQLHDKIGKKIGPDFKITMTQFVQKAIARKELVRLPFEVYWSIAFAPLYQLIKFHSEGKSHVNEKFKLTDKEMTLSVELVLKALKP
ncbi:MAG: TetR/AcrR family transcriptional regulator [Cyclobacteriaceae bacterium]